MQKLKVLLLLFVVYCVFGYTSYLDIPYYPDGEAPQLDKNMLDIFVPDYVDENTPVLFFVHGGTWMAGDRTEYRALGDIFTEQEGWVTVIISYRLSDEEHPEVHHPDHITDVATAFVWTRDHIEDYTGDVGKMFICGHSAGAHLITLLATNTTYLEDAGGSVEDIDGAISLCLGLYDLNKLYNDFGMMASVVWPYLPFESIFSSDTMVWRDASPKYHLHDDMPPFVFMVAEDDMEHIIGGTYYGMVDVPGEVQFVYDDFNMYQPTDTFWLIGDHTTCVETLAYNEDSRGRNLMRDFINDVIDEVEENRFTPNNMQIAASPNPFNGACVINVNEPSSAIIYDNNGREIARFSEAESFTWKPDNNTPSGSYYFVVHNDSGKKTSQINYIK